MCGEVHGYPYLQTVQTSGEDEYSQYSSEVEFTKDELIKKIKENHKNFDIDFSKEDCIKIIEYTEGGRVKTIKFGNIEMSGVEVRMLLGLKSANFKIAVIEDKIKFEVTGYRPWSRNEPNRCRRTSKTRKELYRNN